MVTPKILYKYRDVGENTEKIFMDKTIWLSKPSNLNDPFECSISNFTDKAKYALVRKRKLIQISGFFYWGTYFLEKNRTFYGMSGKTLKSFLKKLQTKTNQRKYQLINEVMYNSSGIRLSNPNDIIKSLENRLSEIGIFSLSETDTNQLMWAHYGGESRGVALGFEVTIGSKLADEKYCIKVNYVDDLPKFDDEKLFAELQYIAGQERPQFIVPFDDPTFRACVSTKPSDWGYEKEWRYIDETDGLHSFPGKLVEIVFGLRCSSETRNKYRELVSKNFDYPIRFYEIVKKANSNQIEKIEILNK